MSLVILVVDDNASVLVSLRIALRNRGYAVVEAPNALHALAILARVHVHAALLDVHMPGMNGIDLCRSLFSHMAQTGRSFPVWMMCGAVTPLIRQQAQIAGAQAVFEKPFDHDELFQRLEEKLGPPPVR